MGLCIKEGSNRSSTSPMERIQILIKAAEAKKQNAEQAQNALVNALVKDSLDQEKVMADQEKVIADQEKVIADLLSKLEEARVTLKKWENTHEKQENEIGTLKVQVEHAKRLIGELTGVKSIF